MWIEKRRQQHRVYWRKPADGKDSSRGSPSLFGPNSGIEGPRALGFAVHDVDRLSGGWAVAATRKAAPRHRHRTENPSSTTTSARTAHSDRTSSALLHLQQAGALGCRPLDSRSGPQCVVSRAIDAPGDARLGRPFPCRCGDDIGGGSWLVQAHRLLGAVGRVEVGEVHQAGGEVRTGVLAQGAAALEGQCS